MVATNYFWNPVFDCITKETNDAGAVTARYTQEPKLYGGLISQHRSGATSIYHYDSIGTTRALTDSSQNVTDTAVYMAFGEKAASTGGTDNPFNYVGLRGYCELSNSHSKYVRRRNYSESLGRWLSVDPIRFDTRSNYFQYANNCPTALIDPSGLVPICQAQTGNGREPLYWSYLKDRSFTCTKLANHFRSAPENRDLISLLLRTFTCSVPSIKCIRCPPNADYGGYYDGNTNTIVICDGNDFDFIRGAVRHELIHAVDNCYGENSNDCFAYACGEVRASSNSGQCDPPYGSSFTARPWLTRVECVFWQAVESTVGACGDEAMAMSLVQYVFYRCYIASATRTPSRRFPDLPLPPGPIGSGPFLGPIRF